MIDLLILALGLAACLGPAQHPSRIPSRASAIISLLDTLAGDSASGFARISRDSALVNLTDLSWFGSEEIVDSLKQVGLQIRHNAYTECGATEGPASRAARAACALRDFPFYVELAHVADVGDSATAQVTVSHISETAPHSGSWYRRMGTTLAAVVGRHQPPRPPIWFRIYTATFSRGADGDWTMVQLRPLQPMAVGRP